MKINDCEKCGGEGWLWWHELDSDYYPKGGQDDTKYTCDACHAEPVEAIIQERFDPAI